MLSARTPQSYSGQFSLRHQQQQQRGGDRPAAAGACGSPRVGGAPPPDQLLTDRSSYISYLESQLERVSAACLVRLECGCARAACRKAHRNAPNPPPPHVHCRADCSLI